LKPNPIYGHITISSISTEPRAVHLALKHIDWTATMLEELHKTWEFVPRQSLMNVVGCNWVYKEKLHGDESLDLLKA